MAKGARSWDSACAGARLWVGRRHKRMRTAVLMGTDVTMAVLVSAENANAVEAEPPRAEAAVPPVQEEPAAAAESQQGSAARPEGSKRGRPKTSGERGESGGQARGNGRSRYLTFKGVSNTYHDAGNNRCYHK
ncbi:MAG: hypothetical protein WCP70_09090 [Methanothrix sp.]